MLRPPLALTLPLALGLTFRRLLDIALILLRHHPMAQSTQLAPSQLPPPSLLHFAPVAQLLLLPRMLPLLPARQTDWRSRFLHSISQEQELSHSSVQLTPIQSLVQELQPPLAW